MSNFDQRLQRLARARLYAIVDTGYVEPGRVPYVTEQLVLGGVDLIQLRAKKLPLSAIAELGKKMRAIIPLSGPLFILNDHPELVPEIGADGIHVGQDDLSVAEARTRAGARAKAGAEVIVGKSTHSLNQAIAAEKEGANYIGVGPIYATPTKPDYAPVGPALIGQVRAAVRVPQFCIGGINEKTFPEVVVAGARRVVIVSALLQSQDIPGYCLRVRKKLETLPTFPKMSWERLFVPLSDKIHIRKARDRLSKRPQLDSEAFANTYFPEEKQVIARKLWEITKEHSVADITGLWPEDEFVADLKMDDLDSLSTVEILVHIEKDFEVVITDERAVRIRTFGELVDEIYQLKRME